MKIFYLTLLSFVLVFPSLSFAQSNSMRSLAVSQLYVYGEAVYNRGDLLEAAQVFSKILSMEPTHPAALKIAQKLKSKGYEVFIPETPIATPPVKGTPSVVQQPVVDPNQDLKDNIQQVDDQIENIRKDVGSLKDQIDQSKKDVL